MEEIKVGEYIRFNDGIIAKVKKIKKAYQDNEYYIHYSLDENNIRNYSGITTERSNVKNVIKKHSFNIAKILEEGDYVNGYKVIEIQVQYVRMNGNHDYIVKLANRTGISSGQIKSIVTKEQFKAMEYEVK